MIVWPGSLIREIARRRVVLFLGSGVSAASESSDGNHPPTWSEFLRNATNLIFSPIVRTEISTLIEERKYLLALQAISDEANAGDYRELLDECFNNPAYQPSDLHKIIFGLDAGIVVTTNFDKIYDNFCESYSTEGYKIVNYDSSDLGDLIRSDRRLIIKAHGSINDIRGMIFTRSQYHQAKSDHPQFYELLKAIFLTHTCIFIGCGLEDPDVLLLLEEVKIASSSTKPHYILIRQNDHNKYSKQEWKDAYNISSLEYGAEHSDLVEDLDNLLSSVDEFRSNQGL